jgi:hypothetical protein
MKPEIKTVGDLLYWAYSNLAMAHAAITDGFIEYNKKHYFIRSRLFKGLKDNSMDIRSFFDDERLKMILPQSCCYCGATEHLAADHIIPRKEGGLDIGENLIWACRSCNSSKSAIDMLEWMQSKNVFPSVLLYRRYLKILINYCRDENLINMPIIEAQKSNLPFNLSSIPQEFLLLSTMKLWVTDIENLSTYRIANWNLERPLKKDEKLELAVNKIQEIAPDICILTETSKLVNLGKKYTVIHSQEYPDIPNEHWAAIWSKWPIKKQIPTFDSHRTTCALIGAPFGEIIVYATIIPYHNAGVLDGGKYSYAPGKYKAWQMHKENTILQSADWLKISADFQGVPLVVAGDFNQTRDSLKGGYGTKATRELMTMALEICNLSCVTTEDFAESGKLSKDPKKGTVRRNIDHICISTDWKEKLKIDIGAWDHFTGDGKYMSDHNGVYLEFTM